MNKPLITKTVKRIAIWYAAIMVGFYLLFNIYTLVELNYILIDDIDSRLAHELEHILNTLEIVDDKVNILSPSELEEPDLFTLTENPYFLQVYDKEGYLFFGSNNLSHYEEIDLGFPNNFSPYYFEDATSSIDRLRTVYKELINQNDETIGFIQLSAIHSSFNEVLNSFIYLNLISLPIFLILIVVVSIFLAKKSYDPINNIINLANSISATNLKQRLDYDADNNDELGRLKKTLNDLFDRLEDQIQEISQFTDNASHQLMTPLTAVKTELEYILKREYPIKEYQETCNILKSQTDRMILMVKSMLIMSRECSDCSDNKNVFQCSNLINNEIKKIYFKRNISYDVDDNIYLRGKAEYFSLVIQNLINNAIKYSEENSKIEVLAEKKDDKLILSVLDQGIGIDNSEKKKIFNRFYRSDADEINKVSGYGLGLSLVKSVVESMGGEIEIKDNFPKGAIFTLTLPIMVFK